MKNMFIVHGLKWFLEVSKGKERSEIVLKVLLPNTIQAIWIAYEFFEDENMDNCDIVCLKSNDGFIGLSNVFVNKKRHNNDHEIKQYKVLITLVDIFDVNGCSVKYKYIHALKYWLKDKVGLPIYYEILKQNNINMSNISLLTMDKLNEFGITDINHQIRILHQVAKFKEHFGIHTDFFL
eukprot:92743_1